MFKFLFTPNGGVLKRNEKLLTNGLREPGWPRFICIALRGNSLGYIRLLRHSPLLRYSTSLCYIRSVSSWFGRAKNRT